MSSDLNLCINDVLYIMKIMMYPSNQKLVQDLGNLSHIDLSQTWFKS